MDILMKNKHEMIPTTDEHGQVRKVRGIFFNHGQARIDTETQMYIPWFSAVQCSSVVRT